MNNPILIGGEYYTKVVEKKSPPGNKKYNKTYEESRTNLISNIEAILDSIKEMPEIFLDEKTYCIRLEDGFNAKSYTPNSLIKVNNAKIVGGRKYKLTECSEHTKLYFVKGREEGLENLLNTLSNDLKITNDWENVIRSINRIDFLSESEKISSFPVDWAEGPVEIVMHPEISKDEYELESLIEYLGIDEKEYASKKYEDGPIFCSMHCSKEQLSHISKLNYVRTIHPIDFGEIEFREDSAKSITPDLELNETPRTTIGIFDGGIHKNHPILNQYVNSYDLTGLDPVPSAVEHGTAVCSAAIFGNIDSQILEPNVNVNLYRIHPMPRDSAYFSLELYEIINKIEETVGKDNALESIYSLSIGPRGSIIDDEVSRFTYSLDKLSMIERYPLFCTAIGNTGNLPYPVNRIHAPGDMVNGLSVGAYEHNHLGLSTVSNYSSHGPGREGSKIKPDVLEFGGSEKDPLFVLSKDPDRLIGRHGTSFSAPILAGKIGKMLSQSDDLDAHLARALVIHTAEKLPGFDVERIGHGICKPSSDSILSNLNNQMATVTYRGEIRPSCNLRLNILLPPTIYLKDIKLDILWTIVCLARPNPCDVDSYTGNCIEDTFYPNENFFPYYKENDKGNRIYKKALTGSDKERIYLQEGFKKSKYPASESSSHYSDESSKRKYNYKWDTVVKKQISINARDLLNPHLVLHANTRDGDKTPTKYYAVVSVKASNYPNFYSEVVSEYRQIAPIRLKNLGRVDVKN